MPKISRKNDNSRRKGWLITLLMLLFIIASGFYYLVTQVREAKRTEQLLIDRFGQTDTFTPQINGAMSPARIEGFVRVRQALQSHCIDYQAILNSLIDLETLDSNHELSTSDAASMGMESVKSVFSAGPKLLEFSETRNKTLLAEEMGLGEYMYIYLTAYGEQLSHEPDSRYSGMEEAYISPRTRREFVQILSNQLTALEAANQEPTHADFASRLHDEIRLLVDGSHSAPWPKGPDEMARTSLAPYQEQIADLYCSGMVRIELMQKNRGFQFDG